MNRTAGFVAVVALVLGLGGAARAQVPGDQVRIETVDGVVEGLLVDRLPQGYLVNRGKATEVVPYTAVRGVSRVDPAGAAADAPGEAPLPLVVGPETLPPPPPPGDGQVEPLVVPAEALPVQPPPAPIELRRRSRALMGVGIAMFAAGLVTATTGGGVFIRGSSDRYSNDMDVGTLMLGAGLTLAAVGIPLWAIGGAKVPVQTATAPSVVPALALGPTSARATWRF